MGFGFINSTNARWRSRCNCCEWCENAGILAQIIGSHDKEIMDKMIAYKLSLKEAVYKSSEN
jgi:phosphoribosylcarboxyaminoimidazole (NCAIR) mutase